MSQLKAELRFLVSLIGVNLSSAMEYRASFISQIVGMFINNGIYFVFWLIFFDRFGAIRGYDIDEIYLLFAIVTLGFGMSVMFAGNTGQFMAYTIAQGRLDYYLVFPRNLLIHVIFSRMRVSAIGDLSFGIIAYLFTGRFHPLDILMFLVVSLLAGLFFTGFTIITGSLAFYMGNAQHASQQMNNAVLTFAFYPNTIFSGMARFLLYTLVPAGFIGAMPVEILTERNTMLLAVLVLAVVLVWSLATATFYLGLRRYESGSAINVNV